MLSIKVTYDILPLDYDKINVRTIDKNIPQRGRLGSVTQSELRMNWYTGYATTNWLHDIIISAGDLVFI